MPSKRERAPDAFEQGVRALRSRDLSEAALAARLERRGATEGERDEAVERLRSLGYVDDERFAHGRAQALAARGAGDLLIADDLGRHGVDAETAAGAMAALEPERMRAARVVDERGQSLRTVRYLAAKGFGEETIEGVIAALPDDRLG